MEIDGAGSERVAILDAGAQFGRVIDRREMELNVEGVILLGETIIKLGDSFQLE
jgi:hypothetical protein